MMFSIRRQFSGWLGTGWLALAVLAGAFPTAVVAGVRIEGDVQSVRLDLTDATLDEALTALGSTFRLRYRASIPLSNRLTGTYRGSVGRVVSRLLAEYDFVVITSPSDGIEIIVTTGGVPPVARAVSAAAGGNAASLVSQAPVTAGTERAARSRVRR